jgi:hypothetical protein
MEISQDIVYNVIILGGRPRRPIEHALLAFGGSVRAGGVYCGIWILQSSRSWQYDIALITSRGENSTLKRSYGECGDHPTFQAVGHIILDIIFLISSETKFSM